MSPEAFVTGEAVALDLRRAGLASRLLAGGIDGLAQLALLIALAALAGASGAASSGAAFAALSVVVVVVVLAGYPLAFESLMRGRTPGKAAMGLRVVRDDGGPIGFRQALVRSLAGMFVERPGITLYSAAVVTMALNSHGKRVGDLLAGTVVIQERVAGRSSPPVSIPPPLRGWAAGLDLTGLPDSLAVSARSFLARWPQLNDGSRAQLGDRLARAVASHVSPPPPPGTPAWAYLAAVLGERRRRAGLGAAPSSPIAQPAEPRPTPAVPVAAAPVLPPEEPQQSSTGFAPPG